MTPHPTINQITGFETSSRPKLLKYGTHFHPNVVVQSSFANKKIIYGDIFFVPCFIVSSSHKTFVKGIAGCFGGAIAVKISQSSR